MFDTLLEGYKPASSTDDKSASESKQQETSVTTDDEHSRRTSETASNGSDVPTEKMDDTAVGIFISTLSHFIDCI